MPQIKSVRNSLSNSFYLSLGVLLTWFWTNNPVLLHYNLQLTAFLLALYFIFRLFRKRGFKTEETYIFDTTIFNIVLLLIVSITGALNSPLFFLIYFELFAIALIYETIPTLTLTLALTLFFSNSLNSFPAAIQLLSLVFFTGLAIYFGKQYSKLLTARERIKELNFKNRRQLAISNKQLANLAYEETNSLLWLSLNLKNGLLKIIHQTANLISDTGHTTLSQKETLQSIHDTAKDLLKSGEKLKEKIDKETD